MATKRTVLYTDGTSIINKLSNNVKNCDGEDMIPSAICNSNIPKPPETNCEESGSPYFEGISDVTINQGVGIDLTEGVKAYDSFGNEIEYTVSPSEISMCSVGTFDVEYQAVGDSNVKELIPTMCNGYGLHIPDNGCNLEIIKANRKVTITQAEDPTLSMSNPLKIEEGTTINVKDGVTAVDDNGNLLDVLVSSSETVTFDTAGVYEITYTAEDCCGNKTVEVREIIVGDDGLLATEDDVIITTEDGEAIEPVLEAENLLATENDVIITTQNGEALSVQ